MLRVDHHAGMDRQHDQRRQAHGCGTDDAPLDSHRALLHRPRELPRVPPGQRRRPHRQGQGQLHHLEPSFGPDGSEQAQRRDRGPGPTVGESPAELHVQGWQAGHLRLAHGHFRRRLRRADQRQPMEGPAPQLPLQRDPLHHPPVRRRRDRAGGLSRDLPRLQPRPRGRWETVRVLHDTQRQLLQYAHDGGGGKPAQDPGRAVRGDDGSARGGQQDGELHRVRPGQRRGGQAGRSYHLQQHSHL
mmetsp:Transcript_21225/g.45338  ORF Transcript_21225/g.45338 Transcript_21225/m.45338 type:complete len:244 (-) Transcript_21225:2133-2864(-)